MQTNRTRYSLGSSRRLLAAAAWRMNAVAKGYRTQCSYNGRQQVNPKAIEIGADDRGRQ